MEMDLHERLKAAKIVNAGGGGEPPVFIEKEINQNGVYIALDDEVDGYSKVTVDVSNTYTAEDEGKVVDNGALVAQTAMLSEVTENGTVDTTRYNSVTVNVPSGGKGYIEYITGNTFYFDKATYIKIPDGYKELVTGCFNSFSWLTEIELPATLISISSKAFYNCYSLLNIDLPNGLTTIGSNAFYGCSGLTEIEIPSTVENIYASAFGNCTSLQTITINKPENSISGKPWGATNATIIWTG